MSDCTASAPLSIPIGNSGASGPEDLSADAEARRKRWRALEAAAAALEGHTDDAGKPFGTCICCKYLSFGRTMVELKRDAERRRGRLAGLTRCTSVWLCPWCSWYIAQGRSVELLQALTDAEAQGWSVVFVTHTLPHTARDACQESLDTLKAALRDTLHDKPIRALRARYDAVGYVRGLEVTYSTYNGFHPHAHYLWFFRRRLSAAEVRAFGDALWATWERKCAARGRVVQRQGFKVETVRTSEDREKLAKYLSGAANEVTKAHVKQGRKYGGNADHYTMFELLDLFAAGRHLELRRVFVEYAQAVKGSAQVLWSPGLKAVFGIVDVSDAEHAEAAPEFATWGYLLAGLPWVKAVGAGARWRIEYLVGEDDRSGLVALMRKYGDRTAVVFDSDAPPGPAPDYGARLIPDLLAWRAEHGYA